MRALEVQIGARLFERSGKGVKLTPTGERFFEHAVRITDATRQALADTAKNADTTDRITQRRQAKPGRKRAASP